MVIMLPEAPSFSTEFARRFGEGANKAITSFSENVQAKESLQKENEALKLLGIDVTGVTNPHVRQAVITQGLKGQQREKENDRLMQALEEKRSSNKPSEHQTSENERKFDWSDEDIADITIMNPKVGNALRQGKNAETKEMRENTKALERKHEALRKETLPLRSEIAERAIAAEHSLDNKDQLMKLIDAGDINHPIFATLMEQLPFRLGQQFLTPDTLAYKAGLVQGYGDLKNIFTGATRVKEVEILENKIADLYLTDTQKKAVIKSMSEASKADIIRGEAAAELEKDGRPMGIAEYTKELQKRSKEKLNAAFDRIIDQQEAIVKDAENIKKMPLDLSDPESLQIIDQLILEAGGDVKKAESLAKKKGYKW